MDRVARFNVLAMSGRAVEASGDVDVILLDKTGTITYGNRLAASITPAAGVSEAEAIDAALVSSIRDETPEGRSIVELARKRLAELGRPAGVGDDAGFAKLSETIVEEIAFRAETRTSGVKTTGGITILKGAVDAIATKVGVPAARASPPRPTGSPISAPRRSSSRARAESSASSSSRTPSRRGSSSASPSSAGWASGR